MRYFNAAKEDPSVMLAENFKFSRQMCRKFCHYLKLHVYKIQTVQAMEPDDWLHQEEFGVDTLRQYIPPTPFT
jgi:hypothetical protein